MSSRISSATRAKKTAELRRLNTLATAAAAKAQSAKLELRAAKAKLKQARKLSKQSKRAAKQARKRAQAAASALKRAPIKRAVGKSLVTPAKTKPSSAKPRQARAPRAVTAAMRSPAAVARSVIRRLNGAPAPSSHSMAPRVAPPPKTMNPEVPVMSSLPVAEGSGTR